MINLQDKEISIPTENGNIEAILLSVTEHQGKLLGIFVHKNVLNNYLEKDNVYLDFKVCEIYDFSTDSEGNIDISLAEIKELPQKDFNKVIEKMDNAKEVIEKYLNRK